MSAPALWGVLVMQAAEKGANPAARPTLQPTVYYSKEDAERVIRFANWGKTRKVFHVVRLDVQ